MLSMLCAFWMIYIYTLMDCPWFTKHIYMLMWMMSFKKTLTTCVYLFCLSCLCLVLLCCARPLLLWFVGPLLLLLVFLYVSLGIASLLPMFVLLCVPICCTSIAALITFNRLVCWSYTICDENYRWPMVTNEDDIWSKVARSLNIHIPSEVILFLPLSTKSCLNHIMAPIINVRGKDKDICELSLRNRRHIGQLWRRSYCLSWRSSKKGYPSG